MFKSLQLKKGIREFYFLLIYFQLINLFVLLAKELLTKILLSKSGTLVNPKIFIKNAEARKLASSLAFMDYANEHCSSN